MLQAWFANPRGFTGAGLVPFARMLYARRELITEMVRRQLRDEHMGQAIGVFAGIAYATMAIAAFLLPETKGKVLAA